MKKYFSIFFLGVVSLFFATLFTSCADEEVTFPTGRLVTISELQTNYDAYDGDIIRLENVQFTPADTNKAFNGGVGNGTGSRNLQECATGSTVVVFTAASSDFTNLKTPTGKGYFVGKASKFGTTVQILILDRNSFQNMTGERCVPGSGGGGGTNTATLATILQVRDLAAAKNVVGTTSYTITEDWKIKGIVTSDASGGNILGQNLFIQNVGGKGIALRFATAHTFALGDELEISLKGTTLSRFNELLQIGGTGLVLANAVKTGTGVINPTIVSVAQIEAGNNESELVTVQGVTFNNANGTVKYTDNSGNQPITQAGSTTTVFSRTTTQTPVSTWANNIVPSTGSVTGHASIFKTGTTIGTGRQLLPRRTSDVP